MKHPDFEKLVDGFENLEPHAAAREIAAHFESCAECAARAARLRSFFRYARAGKNAEVSQADTAALLNIFKPEKNISAAAGRFGSGDAGIKTLLAALVFED